MGYNRFTPTMKYIGGKYMQLPWLLPRLPVDARVYCEPFGGSGVVLANRPRAAVEVYNDLNKNMANFYRVLPERWQDLKDRLALTPYGLADFQAAMDLDVEDDPFEWAWRYYICVWQSWFGLGSTKPTTWGFDLKPEVSNSPGLCVCRYMSSQYKLKWLADRMRGVVVETMPAVEVMRKYDAPDAFFYLDPPYVMSGRNSDANMYANEMTDDEHVELLNAMKALRGRWVISGYDNALYNDMLAGYSSYTSAPHVSAFTNHNLDRRETTIRRTEMAWANFDIESELDTDEATLFDKPL